MIGSILLLLPLSIASLLVLRRVIFWLSAAFSHSALPRPPFALDWLPFIGHAFSLTDEDRFWPAMSTRYGPIFCATAMGTTRVFITNQPMIAHVYKTTKKEHYDVNQKTYFVDLFGTTRQAAYDPIWEDSLFRAHTAGLAPGGLAQGLVKYAEHAEACIKRIAHQAGESGSVQSLATCVMGIVYEASSLALMGPKFPIASSIDDFIAFDVALPLLSLTNLPSFALRPAVSARDKILDVIEGWVTSLSDADKQAVAPHINTIFEGQRQAEWSSRDVSAILLGDLWALQGNAPYAAIFAAAEIVRHESEGLAAELRIEVEDAIRALEPPELSMLLRSTPPELVAKLPKVNAVLQETLRYYSSSYSIRTALDDMVLPARLCGDGPGKHAGLTVKKGEQLVCITRVSHIASEGEGWGPTADQWDWRRMLNGKKGRMMPFGGGVSMCHGRHFASGELLTFLACFVTLLDVQIIPGEDKLTVDKTRIGLGMQHCKGEMKVLIRKRKHI